MKLGVALAVSVFVAAIGWGLYTPKTPTPTKPEIVQLETDLHDLPSVICMGLRGSYLRGYQDAVSGRPVASMNDPDLFGPCPPVVEHPRTPTPVRHSFSDRIQKRDTPTPVLTPTPHCQWVTIEDGGDTRALHGDWHAPWCTPIPEKP